MSAASVVFWETLGARKSFYCPFDLKLFNTHVPRDTPVLDYGCGYGRVTRLLCQHGYTRLTGADPSAAMLKRAHKNAPAAQLHLIAPSAVPFPDGSFGAVILFSVLSSMLTDEMQFQLVDELHRVLSPRGVLYVSDFLLRSEVLYRPRYERGKEHYGVHGAFLHREGTHVVPFRHRNREGYEALFSRFEPLHVTETEACSMNGRSLPVFQLLARKP